MLAPLLLGMSLALAPTSETTRVEMWANGEAGYSSADFSGPGRVVPRATITGGGAWGGIGVFFKSVVDDDAAPALQPYLQRAGQLSLSARGGTWTTDYGARFLPVGDSGGGASLDAHGYFGPGRALYGGGGVRVDYNTTHYGDTEKDTSRFAIPIWVGAGVRWRELRVRRLELSAEAFVLDKGGSADANAELWLARRFGIALTVNGGHETPSTTHRTQDFFGVRAALDWWFTARFAVNVSYLPEWRRYTGNDAPTTTSVEHLVTFGLVGRPL